MIEFNDENGIFGINSQLDLSAEAGNEFGGNTNHDVKITGEAQEVHLAIEQWLQ
ncbi:MAG: hypothetical protein U5L96_05105 [Owenweeksia sp.]|nr:hypothetical protein [Owenweeksia sp.]